MATETDSVKLSFREQNNNLRWFSLEQIINIVLKRAIQINDFDISTLG
jgi:hypothetical protein